MKRRISLVACSLLLIACPLHAQLPSNATPDAETLVRATAPPVTIAAGGRATVVVRLAIEPGWHVNANPPALEYNIPTRVALANGYGVRAGNPNYPAPRKVKFSFEDSEMLVWDGNVEVTLPLAADPNAVTGAHVLKGFVEFQSCNDQVCLPPTKVPFSVSVTVTGGSATGAGLDTTVAVEPAPGPAQGTGFATSAPAGYSAQQASAAKSKLGDALARGGMGWFLALFVGGLLLNLTPCVFPMLGVTVSIFGARQKQPLPKVLLSAMLYVLGICAMYSALGVVAALTGSLFGSALQNAWVGVGLGVLMFALSLSMFGVYEMQTPTWMLDRLGGAQATSLVGMFFSGLAVGIIAAPCVGPFVVAVLALIAQRGSWEFGLQTMFTLSLGLGFPYLFLATFSNLLQSLPRSGEWMVWVKKLFGVVMASMGLYFVLIGLAPRLAPWVLPSAMLLGGLYLGFMEKSANDRKAFRAFKRGAGAVSVLGGVALVLMLVDAASRTLEFPAYTEQALAASRKAGRPVMLDFSADWCVPCHELELTTFTDRQVVAAAREFDRYKVDLTKYDSGTSIATKKRYDVKGVPTVVFLRADGTEAPGSRVEGFVKPKEFLERMRLAVAR